MLVRKLIFSGALLLLASLTLFFYPAEEADAKVQELALRQLAHDYLLAKGDSTTTVPSVGRAKNGELWLPLATSVNYDTLSQLARAAVVRYAIEGDYLLTLEDCRDGSIILGGRWSSAGEPAATTSPACSGRAADVGCANVGIRFLGREETAYTSAYLTALGLGVCLIFLYPYGRKKAAVTDPGTNPLHRIAKSCQLDEVTPELRLKSGERRPLTFREGKLLLYLHQNANRVLPREEIKAAVWESEGVVTGRSLDVFISRLRKKLTDVEGVEILTVHGLGYRLRTD